jgi:cystathionine beta-lyase/cystathionine gamma-synthase
MTYGLASPASHAAPESNPGLATRAVRGGARPDPATGAILTPIFQSTTFVQESIGVDKGFTYSRSDNPTVAALERNLAALEGVDHALAFSTGMAALSTIALAFLQQGDHVAISDVVYGGTVRLFRQVLAPFGVEASFFDGADPGSLEAALRPGTKLVLVETPGNPTLKLVDLEVVGAIAKRAGALFAVDNTLLTPALQRPFELGADLVVYSTTKYLEGHNSTVGGAVLAERPELAERLRFVRNATGCIQAPWEAWLTLRGLKTLELRMARHSESALAIATRLDGDPRVTRVIHPGLASFPQRDLARRQQRGGGGMVAIEIAGGLGAAKRFVSALRLISLAESLGAAESLVTHPATMTHAAVPEAARRAAGISDGLVRLSVGLETVEDLLADLDRALAVATSEVSDHAVREPEGVLAGGAA